jgi:hypothetical protein
MYIRSVSLFREPLLRMCSANRPASIRLARSTSSSALRRGTLPICLR